MRIPCPRFSVRRLAAVLAIMAVAAWLWVCFWSGIDSYEAMAYFFTGSCFLLIASAIGSLFFLALLMSPGDPPPRSGPQLAQSPEGHPQFQIRSLMITIAVVAVILALIVLACRVPPR
jgi:hypothetical protein